MTTNTYTLELPATKETLNQLVAKLCAENEPDARVTLVLGTCSLVCMDPADRREFGTLVKQVEAVYVLRNRLQMLSASYTLAVPATDETIYQLVVKISEENEPDERVTLMYGTSCLLCADPEEREVFGTLVKQMEAVFVLWNSLRTRAAILSKCALVQST